jgi:pterin-4a-carbinolamine dehydratase
MNGLLTPRMIRSGARNFVDGRRQIPQIRACRRYGRCSMTSSVHPLSSSDSKASQLMPHHYFLYLNLCKRSIHNEPTSESNNSVQKHFYEQPTRSRTSDPTAKRPTQKCDPYGLAGKSLSYTECSDLMSTLEAGWRLLFETSDNSSDEARIHNQDDRATTIASPTLLQKYYYHPTFHEASKFMSHIALLATNHNHFPHLSIERILVDDVHDISPLGDTADIHGNSHEINTNTGSIRSGLSDSGITKRKGKKIKGWIFRSTVRCSTYRPPSSSLNTTACSFSTQEKVERTLRARVESSSFKGLTYHDFHLAMSIDVEGNREDVKQWLCQSTDILD